MGTTGQRGRPRPATAWRRPDRSGAAAARRRRVWAAVLVVPLLALGAPGAQARGGGRTFPSAGQVRAARARAHAAAARVAALQRRYQADAARLDGLQQDVSVAAAAYAVAADELARRTAAAAIATSRARAADLVASTARARLGQYAAAVYESGGTLGRLGALLSTGGPQQYADTAAGFDAFGSQWAGEADTARSTAAIAVAAQRTADLARSQQETATTAAHQAEADAQAKVAAAAAQVQTITAEQHTMVAQLASLRHTSKVLEQRRQDGLAAAAAARAAAARAAARAGRGSAVLTSGGGPGLTAAQLDPRAVARRLMPAYGFGPSQWGCLNSLWNGESGWRWSATNPSSGAYGIPQSLPASKMATAGPDWLVNPVTQIRWGLSYLKRAYGSPCRAWSMWLSRSPHWY